MFESKLLEVEDYQGNAQINYTDYDVPYTRIIEHKHFNWKDNIDHTFITKEYSIDYDKEKNIPYYPINIGKNNSTYNRYKEKANSSNRVIFCGRLGEYKYYNMDDIVYKALELTKKELQNEN